MFIINDIFSGNYDEYDYAFYDAAPDHSFDDGASRDCDDFWAVWFGH